MTQDKARKAATQQRMAETGEPYSVARHAVAREHEGAAAEDPLSPGPRIELDHAKYVPKSEGRAGAHRCTACILTPPRFRPVEYDMAIVKVNLGTRPLRHYAPLVISVKLV